ncbi:hypothetical protein [Larkinella terrae]|uniref:Uncharacterized protein n=1 Tax=Larkinella terrae TaxID=2025311 RepID=A0A7K0EJ55_9BACT|nr:hypothetical protein [Larkinella terrae]MRS61824.1 hypothetical protein [Larkinella terrae]
MPADEPKRPGRKTKAPEEKTQPLYVKVSPASIEILDQQENKSKFVDKAIKEKHRRDSRRRP